MAENETKVLYKAIADFSALSKAARGAKKDLRELREEERRLNAESASGSQKAERARSNKTKAVKEEVAATKAVAAETDKVVKATEREAAAATKAATSHNDATRASLRHADAAKGLSGWLNNAVSGLQRFSSSVDRSSNSQARHRREIEKTGSSSNKATSSVQKFGKAFDKLGTFRPKLVPPFVALIPVLSGVLALIGPLISGISALGGAAIGLASNIGSLGGAALAAIPGLAALLSVVGAMKVAFSGIGGAFKAFGKTQKAGGGGGASKKIELTQAEEIARANEKLRRSYEDVQFAQEDLDDARKDAIKRLDDLRKAVDRAAMSEARARANAQLARENYANVLADPGSTKGEKMDAAVGVDEARVEVADTLDENKQNLADLIEMQQKGIEGDRQVIEAQRRVTDALWAVRDAQIALQNAQKGDAAGGAASAADEYRKALEKLSPSARKVVEFLVSMKGAWDDLTKAVQESFFSKFVDNIERLKLLLGPVQSLLSDTAGAMGDLANKALLQVTSPEWLTDIQTLGKQNVPIIENMGGVLLSVLNILKDLTIAVGPFATKLAEGFNRGADALERLVGNARESGQLASWLDVVYDRLAQWWRILKNIGATLFNFGKAAGDLGQWIADGFERVTEGWKAASEDAVKEGSPFRKFLEDIKPLLSEVAGLLGDFAKMWARIAGDPKNIEMMTGIIKTFRDVWLPAIEGIVQSLSDSDAGQGLVDTITTLLEVVQKFIDGGGAEGMGAFFDTLNTFLSGVGKFIEILPDGAVSAIVSSLGTLSALRFLGFNKVLDLLLKVGKGGGDGILSKLAGLGKSGLGKIPGIKGTGSRVAEEAVSGGRRALGKPSVLNEIKTILAKGLPKAAGGGGGGGVGSKLLGSIGKNGLKGAKGGPIAALASIAVGVAADMLVKDGKGGGRDALGSTLSGAAAGAGTGALVGSVAGPVGTAIGAVGGGVIGGISGFLGSDMGKKWLDGVTENITNFFAELPAKIGQVAGNVWAFLKGIPEWLGEQWAALVQWVTDLPSKLVFAAGYIWQSFINITVWLDEQWVNFQAWLIALPEQIAALAVDLWHALGALNVWLVEQWTNFQNWLISLPGMIAGLAVDIWHALPGIWTWLGEQWTSFSSWVVTLPGRIAAIATSVWNALPSIGGWLADQWATISGWITALPGKVAAAVKGVGGNFMEWLSGTFSAGRAAANADQKRNAGGPIYRAEGGGVPGSGNTDTVPAMLTPGEFVLRKGIVNAVGEDNLSLLNRGVLGLSGMLKRTQNAKGSKGSGNVAFLNGGGMVPGLPGFSGGGAVNASIFSGANEGGNNGFHVENLNVNNPVPESASDSLPKTIRKVSYLGARR